VRRAAAAALLLVLVALVGCDDTKPGKIADSTDQRVVREDTNRGVLMIGDSNVFNSSVAIDKQLTDAGFDPVVHGFPGFGLKEFNVYWKGALAELLRADPAVVIVALGGNDSFFVKQIPLFDVRLDAMMETIGDREVIWLTHVEQRLGPNPTGSAMVNQKIRDAATRWENLTVLDFAKVIDADPSVLAADGLHFSREGTKAYAKAIRDEVVDLYERCDDEVVAGCG
jgi:hypothetical protein